MKKFRIGVVAFFVLLVLFVHTPIYANESSDGMMEEKEDSVMMDNPNESADSKLDKEEMTNEEINSYDLFWPVVAGKTRGDRFYSLKKLKEKVRGLFIFGDEKDAEYDVFIATKRVVEAEKLINEDKPDLANKTIEDAKEYIDKARDKWEDFDGETTDVVHEVNNKLNNLEKFLPYLSGKTANDDLKNSIKDLLQKVVSLNEEV